MDAESRYRRNALLLWFGQFVSITGDSILLVCLAWLAATVGDHESAVGITVFACTAPFVLFGWLAGAWVDRANRRWIMISSDLVRAALLLCFPLAVSGFGLSLPLIATLGFLLATASTPFEPARDALVPRLAGGRPLLRFNASLQTSSYLARIVGLGFGGLLLHWQAGRDEAGLITILTIDGGTYIVSAICLFAIRVPNSGERTATQAQRIWIEARDGLIRVARDRVLGPLIGLTFINNLAIMGTALVGCTLLVRDTYEGTAADLAWLEAGLSVGILIGGIAMMRWRGARNLGRLILIGWILDGITFLPFGWIRSYHAAVALMVLHGCFIPLIVVSRTALIQSYVPDHDRGKVFSIVSMTVQGTTAFSALLAGWVIGWSDPPTLFVAAGIMGALCGVVGLTMIPTLRDSTQAQEYNDGR